MSDPNVPGSVPPTPPPPPSPASPLGSPAPAQFPPEPFPSTDAPGVPDGSAALSDGGSLPDGSPASPDDTFGYPEATAQMPVTGAAAGGLPPGAPPDTGFAEPSGQKPPTPWYKKPGPVIAALVAVAAIAGAVAWLFVGGGDDDPAASPESSLLVIEVTDETGAPIDAGFLVSVSGPATSASDYTWIQPASAVPGQIGGDTTGSDGNVEFEWKPAGATSDPTTWAATVTVEQPIPAGWTPPGPIVECVLARPDTQDTVVSMAVEVDVPDPAVDQIARYSFPNYQFLAGDTVTCQLSSTRPVETTTTTSTTVEETTTTAAATSTTIPPVTTVPVVTVPPQPEATLWDVIVISPDLSELRALVELAGLQDVLSDPDATLTLLAPSNQAITAAAGGVGAPDFGNPAVVEAVLLTHVDDAQALLFTQILALSPPEFVVVNPGPHAIDDAANPPTIGGAEILVADIEASNGVLHVIDRVLLPQTLPD